MQRRLPMHISDSAVTGLTGLDLPPVIGHRGAAGMAPENTLAALRRAHALGCRWVEFDVRLTRDGELILLHDDRLERTTNGCGIARALSLSAIRRFDAGSWFDPAFTEERVPTLAQAIAVLSELGLGANVELKPDQRRCDRNRDRRRRCSYAIVAGTFAGAADLELCSRCPRSRAATGAGDRPGLAITQ